METVKLNNGVEMPILGYGVFQVDPATVEMIIGLAGRQELGDEEVTICLFITAGFSVSAKTQKDKIMKEKVYYKA